MTHIFTQIPADFIDEMIDKNNLMMLGAFCEYARDVQKDRVYPMRTYSKQWFGDYSKKSTAYDWIVKFKTILEAFRISTLKNKVGQKADNIRTKSGQHFEAHTDFEDGEQDNIRTTFGQKADDNKNINIDKDALNNLYLNKEYINTALEEKRTSKSAIQKSFSFSLSKSFMFDALTDEYKTKLWAYAVTKDEADNYQAFEDYHASRASKFKDWSRAYNTWLKNAVDFSKKPNTVPSVVQISNAKEGTMSDAIIMGNRAVLTKTLTVVNITRTEVQREEHQEPKEEHHPHHGSIPSSIGNLAKQMRVA